MKKYLAFDVGGTSVKYAVVNEEGEVSSSNKFKERRYLISPSVKRKFSIHYTTCSNPAKIT